MRTKSPTAMKRVVCRIFIKTTPEAVFDAIYNGPDASIRSTLLSVELRDTLTGYTALTVSCGPDSEQSPATPPVAGAYEWDRLLRDLKTVLEAAEAGGGSGCASPAICAG
jgi:hypothetical protein